MRALIPLCNAVVDLGLTCEDRRSYFVPVSYRFTSAVQDA